MTCAVIGCGLSAPCCDWSASEPGGGERIETLETAPGATAEQVKGVTWAAAALVLIKVIQTDF